MRNRQRVNFKANALQERFIDLWQRCSVGKSARNAEDVYELLLNKYSESNRHYHDVTHLLHCMDQLDQASHLLTETDAIELALWFHDAVYTPGCPDNEQKSAELFMQYAVSGFSDQLKQKVTDLILITRHQDVPKNDDERYISDIDLSSFGFEWKEFLIDTANLRREYIDIPDSDYFRAHTDFLKSLLAKERIFYTDFFYLRFEQTALFNINHLLSDKKYQGY